MKKRRYSAGGGVPVSGGNYDVVPAQYPFPSQGGDPAPTSNTTVNVNGQKAQANKSTGPLDMQDTEEAPDAAPMRRGGKVKANKVRGDGIAQRGKTRGRFV